MFKQIFCLLILLSLFVSPALAEVHLNNVTVQNGVNAVQNEEAINEPLMKILLLSLGIVFFLGLGALFKTGGVSFGGIIVGTPRSAADGLLGMCSVILMGVSLVAGISIYMSWM